MPRRTVLLLQLPIPPLGPGRLRGNVPLAAGYLKMYAELQGLQSGYDIQLLPAAQANSLSEQGLVEAILERDPWMVGFTCYLWNIDRSLWIAQRLKERRPDLKIILGGPEITVDNAWVLQQTSVDFAIIGEGEQTFAVLLQALRHSSSKALQDIPGLVVRQPASRPERFALPQIEDHSPLPGFLPRHPLENLDQISSPYLAGILDAADEEMLLLETIRGCIFKCKFCYYPKSYTGLHFLSNEKIIANLRHARERAAREIVLLDPTLNQRKDFDGFLRLLIQENPGRRMSYFGELRAEGIKPVTAQLLAEANFTEVEVGLQSIDPLAMQLMDRKNNLKAVEKGCQAMLAAGIQVKVDLIMGLPGDTVESVRRSMHYLKDSGIYSDVQVFNLAILPGTAFRQEADELGLVFQPRPPYYVRRTPTINQQDLFDLMEEAAEIFDIEWDPLPEASIREPDGAWQQWVDHRPGRCWGHQAASSRDQATGLYPLVPQRGLLTAFTACLSDHPAVIAGIALHYPSDYLAAPGFSADYHQRSLVRDVVRLPGTAELHGSLLCHAARPSNRCQAIDRPAG